MNVTLSAPASTSCSADRKVCALCEISLISHPIVDGPHAFCCVGCHAVFNILLSKNQMDNFSTHPLFLQALRSGLISNPRLIEQIRQEQQIIEGDVEKFHFEVGEMWCPSCADVIKLMLLREKGIVKCVVDYATDLAAVEFSPRYISKKRIFEIISQWGYSPLSLENDERKAVSRSLFLRFIIAAFCSLNLMMLAYPLYAIYFHHADEGYSHLLAWLSLGISVPVVSYCAWPIWRRFLINLKVGVLGMEILVAIGVAAGFGLSMQSLITGSTYVYFDSMSVIIVFVLLGKIVESKAKFSAKESLLRLSRSTPRRGRKRFPDGSLHFVMLKEIQKGDILVAFAGEKIAIDGVVIESEGACDESLMTGEPIPVLKKQGDAVLGATIVLYGRLVYQVTTSIEETAIHKILEIIERDIGYKSHYVRAADKIVEWFVPVVLSIAIFAAVLCWVLDVVDPDKSPFETALLRGIAILLISCPCAIGIAAPTAESHLLSGLGSIGALVRNRGSLFHLGRETVFIFDKTGTATEGKFSVLSGMENLSEEDRRALYGLASQSMHPVAAAVAAETSQCGTALVFQHIEEIAGQGVKGSASGISYLLGSDRFLKLQGVVPLIQIPEINRSNQVIVSHTYFAQGGECRAKFALGDRVRSELPGVVGKLKPARTILLSGDSEIPVAMVAKACGFDEWRSCCTPLEKREYVETLRKKGEIVCMLGDGINDAAALTAADIGISVVNASDMSIQVSDIFLTTDRLLAIPKMRFLARRGHRIIRQNLFWAFFYNSIGIVLAAFGILSPVFAAFAMSVSSVTVLMNARRLVSKKGLSKLDA